MSNDYTTDPPIATAGQLIAISDKINDLGKSLEKLAEMPQKLDRMNMQLEQLNKEHQQTRNDLTQTRDNLQDEVDRAKSNFKSEIKQVRQESDIKIHNLAEDIRTTKRETEIELRVLNESKTRVTALGDYFKWGGIGLISAIVGSWVALSNDVEESQRKTDENTQKIQVIEKQSDQTQRTLEEIRNKLYERNYRESVNETNR